MNRASIPTVTAPVSWQAGDYGLKAWSMDPAFAVNATTLTNGTNYFAAVVLRSTQLISTLWCGVSTAAVTPVSGQNFMSLYAASGTLLSSGAAVFSPQGVRSVTLDSPQACAAGVYFVHMLANAATPAALSRAIGVIGAPSIQNVNLATTALRFFVNGTGATTPPSSITLANNTATGSATFWVAAS